MKRGYSGRFHNGGGGPLVTDHLHDLDMELELLKRKRLMIEQQQQMLSNEIYDAQPFHRSQPQYDQHQNYGQSRNFSHLYDDGRQGGRGSQFGQNYQSVGHSWELTPSNQYGSQSTDNWGFSSNSKTFPSKPRNPNYAPKNKNFNQKNKINKGSFNNNPTMGKKSFNNAQPFKPKYVPPPNKPSRTGPVHNVKNDFIPTKIVKPKNKFSHAPNNLNQQPLASRKALVAQAMPGAKTKQDPSKVSGEILSANKTPSATVIGRMEHVMGTLLKEAREKFVSVHPAFFNTDKYKMIMKNELRLRIRKVLLGKVVPHMKEIYQLYRAEFPWGTDQSLIKLCQNKKFKHPKPKKVSLKFLPEEQPEEFFRYHFNRLFMSRMDKLLNLLTEIQEQENNREIDDILADLPDIFGEENSNVADEVVEAAAEQSKDVESTQEDIATNASANKSTDETLAEETEVQKNATTESEKTDQVESDAANAVENGTHSKEDVIEIKESDDEKVVNPKKKVRFYRNLMEKLIEIRLPLIVSKKKDYLLKNLDIDTLYRISRAGVLMAANKMAESLNELPSDTTTPPTETTPTVNKIMYYVKVVGKPTLPDKKIMKVFIDTYNPKTIKKHKQVNNLLFIGFASKADQEMILSANGTTVGNKKLVITSSDKFHGANGAPKENDESINTSVNLDNGNASIKEESQCDEGENLEMANENNENVIDSEKNDEKVIDSEKNNENVIGSEKNDENVIGSEKNDENVIDAEKDDNIEKLTEANKEGMQITTIKEELETSNTGISEADVATSQETTPTIKTQEPTPTIETQAPTPAKEPVETNNDNAETGVKNDAVESVKEDVPGGRSTPTRASARLGTATPSTVRTRRASKLAQ